MKMNCANCNKEVERKPSYIKFNQKTFCSVECQSAYLKTGKIYTCAYCGKDVYKTPAQYNKSKSGKVYCNRTCSTSANNTIYRSGENNPNYIDGSGSYRKSILVKECVDCKETRKYMLVVHHKDGNRKNNSIKNLEVLCRNCHTTRHLHQNMKTKEWVFNTSILTDKSFFGE